METHGLGMTLILIFFIFDINNFVIIIHINYNKILIYIHLLFINNIFLFLTIAHLRYYFHIQNPYIDVFLFLKTLTNPAKKKYNHPLKSINLNIFQHIYFHNAIIHASQEINIHNHSHSLE